MTHPTRHQSETSEAGTDTESTLSTELDSDETERFITRWDQSEVSTAEKVRREGSELRLRIDTIGVNLHQTGELLRSETTVKINDGADTDELDGWTLIKPTK